MMTVFSENTMTAFFWRRFLTGRKNQVIAFFSKSRRAAARQKSLCRIFGRFGQITSPKSSTRPHRMSQENFSGDPKQEKSDEVISEEMRSQKFSREITLYL